MRYFIRQTWRNLQESWRVVLQTVLMMGTAMLLLGGFLLLAFNLQQILLRWEQEAPVLLYLKPASTAKTVPRLKKRLGKMEQIRSLRFITAEQAMKRLRNSLGNKGNLLDGLDRPLLPPSLELDLWPWARTPSTVKNLSAVLAKEDGIAEIDYGREWFAPLWQIARLLRFVVFSFGALLLISTTLIVAGTIRLSILLHQQEIDIMRMVGASERFIRTPFYMEGFFEGGLAALLALGSLYLLYVFLFAHFGEEFRHFTGVTLRFLHPRTTFVFLFAGLGTGLLGARIALQRFLKWT